METDKNSIIKDLLPAKKRSHSVVIRVSKVNKSFKVGSRRVKILKGIDLSIYSGEMAIIFGPSGCGKSTLLHTMLGLEKPDKGRVFLRKKSLYRMGEDIRSRWRRLKVGMVFQQSNWIKSLSVKENVAYPLYLADSDTKAVNLKAIEMLKWVGMEWAAEKAPMELSGGEQQRVSLARALITDPGIIFCDEPTGNLDSINGMNLMKILINLNRGEGRKAIVMVTHERAFLPYANRRIFMQDGKIIKDEVS